MNYTDLFDFNLFNDENEKKELPHPYTDYLFRMVSFFYGMFGFHALFNYLHKGILPFNDSYLALFILSCCFILFSIYLPIIFYVHQQFYTRLIVSISYHHENELDVILYDKQNLKITNYEIIDGWIPYASTFFLFIHKVEHYKNTWIFHNERALYYTIKDLDTGVLYLYCIHKEQYLNALQERKTTNSVAMNNISSIIFKSNYFNEDNVKSLLLTQKQFYRLLVFYFVVGAISIVIAFSIAINLFLGILSFLYGVYIMIYNPLYTYSNYLLCSRLIVHAEVNDDNELSIYIHNSSQKIVIKNYKIIDGWRPYFFRFKSFVHKLKNYDKNSFFQLEESIFYSIRDLDNNTYYLFCVNKKDYIKKLESG